MIWRKKKSILFCPKPFPLLFLLLFHVVIQIQCIQLKEMTFPSPSPRLLSTFATDFGVFFSSKTIPCQLITCIITVPTSIVSLAIQEWSCLQSSRSGQCHLVFISSSTEWLRIRCGNEHFVGPRILRNMGFSEKKPLAFFMGKRSKQSMVLFLENFSAWLNGGGVGMYRLR